MKTLALARHFSSLLRGWAKPIPLPAIRSKHSLPDLAYDYDALEPTIFAEIMQLHHQKHHATYVNNLNNAEERMQEALAKGDIRTVIQLEPMIRFNGGGHINHSIFWTNLAKDGGEPRDDLLAAIENDFDSVQCLKDRLTALAVGVQGSGWAWLAFDKNSMNLKLASCPNQDPLQPTTGLIPLFGIDVWEHAYYLQYKNARPDYAKAIWNVANWNNIAERYIKARQ